MEVDKMRFTVGTGGSNDGKPRRPTKAPPVWVPLTVKEVVDWINAKPEYDAFLKSELIKSAQKYPDNALRRFVSDINKHIARIQQKQREDSQQ